MSGQALAIYDVAPVIHSHRVKYVLCDIDPEDVYLLLHGTGLLWLHGCTALELIVAQCSRSAQGRVHVITTRVVALAPDPAGGWDAILVASEGEQWWWWYGLAPHTVGDNLVSHGTRLIGLSSYLVDGVRQYA